VALDPAPFRAGCPYPAARIDGFVGLAGPYDINQWADLAGPMFTRPAAEDPAAWGRADPLKLVTERTGVDRLSVLLVHGEADQDVQPSSSVTFDRLLRQAGYRVQLREIPGADHAAVYAPGVVTGILTRWIASLPSGR
jgi:acetyl esterase/lipase